MKIEWIELPIKGDHRGSLVAFEALRDVPFTIKRNYLVYNVSKGAKRGAHAHKVLRQLAVCIRGSIKMEFDNGTIKESFWMNSPNRAVLIEPMMWHEMSEFSDDSILLVMADDFYDESDYIRSYETFLKLVQKGVP